MGSVTIRIEPQQEPGKTDFDVHLIEEDGNQTSGLLTRAGRQRVEMVSAH